MLKKKNKLVLTIAVVVLIAIAGSCSKLCNSGYEGSRCNELTTTKFIGRWSAADTPGNLAYVDTISQGPVIEDITLSASFAGYYFHHAINASVAGTTITIPYQQPDSDTAYVQGTGTISDNNDLISFTYQIITGADTPQHITNYTGTWSKQN
jgi:hypothetical protein